MSRHSKMCNKWLSCMQKVYYKSLLFTEPCRSYTVSVTPHTSAGMGLSSSVTVETIVPIPEAPVLEINQQNNIIMSTVNSSLTCDGNIYISFQPVQSFEDVVTLSYDLTRSTTIFRQSNGLKDDVAYNVSARVQIAGQMSENSAPILLPPCECLHVSIFIIIITTIYCNSH